MSGPCETSEFRSFYAGRRGQIVRRLLGQHLRAAWPDLTGQRVLGLGYTAPYLGLLPEGAERTVGLATSRQGCARWPEARPSRVARADECCLPLADGSVDRVLMIHALENGGRTRAMLREVWRVLADGGRLLVVVPNRRGLWALSETTPFGQGRPFSMTQLERTLRDALFEPRVTSRALFMPPARSRLLLGGALAFERFGAAWAPKFGGVLVAEAEKSIYAGALTPDAEATRLPKYLVPGRLAAARAAAEPRKPELQPAARTATVHVLRPRRPR